MLTRALGVIVSMSAVYTAFALLVSWIQEQIAGVMNLRGKMLAAGIMQMIGDAATRDQLYGQPAIFGSQAPEKGVAADGGAAGKRQPSYLSAYQFSSAVIGLLSSGKAVATTAEQAFNTAVAGIDTLPDARFKGALQTAAAKAAGNYTTFIGELEQWYDDQCERVTGWYRRTAQICLMIIAVMIACLFNIDSVRLIQAFGSIPLNVAAPADVTDVAQYQAYLSNLVFSSVPLGWPDPPHCAPPNAGSAAPPCHEPTRQASLFYKTFGLLMTAIALTLGAPFWFDTLKRFVNVRNAGPPPPKSADAGA